MNIVLSECEHKYPEPATICLRCHVELGMKLASAQEERKRLTEALESVLYSAVWGHDHWDRMGTHGTNCTLCVQQGIVRDRIRAALIQGEGGR